MHRLTRFAALLDELKDRGAYRFLRSAAGIDFSSNDYLALADSPRIRAALQRGLNAHVPSGSGGSRLLRGNHPQHEELEAQAALFFKTERALLFGSGYAANNALLGTLPQRDDLVVYDDYVHASAHDGMKLGRARTAAFRHNDVGAAEHIIRRWRAEGGTGTPWLIVESVYSMDGDLAPLGDLCQLAERTDAFLVVDEAHATGVYGAEGRGLADGCEGREYVIALHTGGKALGVSGALVTGPAVLCDFLINRGRSFIFATAPPPLVALALQESLAILREEPQRRERLAALVAHARRQIGDRLGLATPATHILPLIIGESAATLRIAQALNAAGFDVRAIRPPTVPPGTSRLRISLTLHVDEAAIEALVGAVGAVLPDAIPTAPG